MANGFDIWGVIASVLGLLNMFQFIAAVIHNRLPRRRLRVFDDTLEETEGLLRSVEEEGLFDDDGGRFMSGVKTRVANVCNRARSLRGDAFTAQTLSQEVTQWWRGLSRRITVCCKDLRALSAQVATASDERRKALAHRRSHLDVRDLSQSDPASTVEIAVTPPEGITRSSEEDNKIQDLPPEVAGERISADIDEQVPIISATPAETNDTPRRLLACTDTPPSYRRQSSLPPYVSSLPLATTVFARCNLTSADAARATRKLVRAYRRNLMVHNVPWQPHAHGAQPLRNGTSAAASAGAVDRPSNAPRHWRLLKAKSKSRIRPYVTVLLHETTSILPHATTPVDVEA